MAQPITPGELIDRVRFERRAVVADDGYGNTEGDFETLIAGRAARLTPTLMAGDAAEVVIAARQQGRQLWDLWVRSDSATRGVKTDDRVVDARDATRTFNVKSVGDMTGDRRWLLVQLESGTADG
jgi:hypothetical protein